MSTRNIFKTNYVKVLKFVENIFGQQLAYRNVQKLQLFGSSKSWEIFRISRTCHVIFSQSNVLGT